MLWEQLLKISGTFARINNGWGQRKKMALFPGYWPKTLLRLCFQAGNHRACFKRRRNYCQRLLRDFSPPVVSRGTKATITRYLKVGLEHRKRAADLIRSEQSQQPGSLLISTYKDHSWPRDRYTCSHLALSCVNRSSELKRQKGTNEDTIRRTCISDMATLVQVHFREAGTCNG